MSGFQQLYSCLWCVMSLIFHGVPLKCLLVLCGHLSHSVHKHSPTCDESLWVMSLTWRKQMTVQTLYLCYSWIPHTIFFACQTNYCVDHKYRDVATTPLPHICGPACDSVVAHADHIKDTLVPYLLDCLHILRHWGSKCYFYSTLMSCKLGNSRIMQI